MNKGPSIIENSVILLFTTGEPIGELSPVVSVLKNALNQATRFPERNQNI